MVVWQWSVTVCCMICVFDDISFNSLTDIDCSKTERFLVGHFLSQYSCEFVSERIVYAAFVINIIYVHNSFVCSKCEIQTRTWPHRHSNKRICTHKDTCTEHQHIQAYVSSACSNAPHRIHHWIVDFARHARCVSFQRQYVRSHIIW